MLYDLMSRRFRPAPPQIEPPFLPGATYERHRLGRDHLIDKSSTPGLPSIEWRWSDRDRVWLNRAVGMPEAAP